MTASMPAFSFSEPMTITFIIYITAMIIIGIYAYVATTNFGDYILGGRRLGSVVTALSAGASDMSGWLLMGLPGAIFLSGVSVGWMVIGLVIGAYLNWLFVASRLRVHTELNKNALTLPDYFTARFEDGSKVLRLFSAIIILVFFTLYCASGIVAGAKLFESMFHIDYSTALIIGAGATIFYTFIGGFLAVSWTDTVQATLMLFALILTPVMVLLSIGSFQTAMNEIIIQGTQRLNMLDGLDIIAIISLLGWGLGYFGQPHILARFMAAESHLIIKNARRISMTWMILCLCGAMGVGFFGIAYFASHPSVAILVNDGKHERIFIELAKLLFNPWIAGVLLSAILAAIMSTLSCQLLVSSSAVTEDLYRAFFRPTASQKELVWVGRLMVLVIALIAILIALDPENSVLGLVGEAWAGFGAAFGPVIILSLFWSRMNRYGALLGMVAGALTVLLWNKFHWFELYSLIPGFIIGFIVIIIVSLLTKKPSKKMITRFNLAKEVLANQTVTLQKENKTSI